MRTSELLRDVIADDIRNRIVKGRVQPGQRIREDEEDEIADDHGVSRVPVREALQKLQTEGYVTLTPYRGARVLVPSTEAALHAMEIRRALEVMAARLAARARGGVHNGDLARVVELGGAAIATGELGSIPELATLFHETVAKASNNPEIVELLALYRGRVAWMFSHDLEHRAEDAWQDHIAVFQAILDGDEQQAGDLMDAHIRKDEDTVRSSFSD